MNDDTPKTVADKAAEWAVAITLVGTALIALAWTVKMVLL